MKRRLFFGSIGAVVASLFGGRAKAGEFDPLTPPRDGMGRCVKRVYRENAKGEWHEIKLSEIKPRDRLICLGLDGTRLWCCHAILVDEPGYDAGMDGPRGSGGSYLADYLDLMTWNANVTT